MISKLLNSLKNNEAKNIINDDDDLYPFKKLRISSKYLIDEYHEEMFKADIFQIIEILEYKGVSPFELHGLGKSKGLYKIFVRALAEHKLPVGVDYVNSVYLVEDMKGYNFTVFIKVPNSKCIIKLIYEGFVLKKAFLM